MSNSSDNDDFTSNLYKMRGRSDSLGKESAGGELYADDHSDSPNGLPKLEMFSLHLQLLEL